MGISSAMSTSNDGHLKKKNALAISRSHRAVIKFPGLGQRKFEWTVCAVMLASCESPSRRFEKKSCRFHLFPLNNMLGSDPSNTKKTTFSRLLPPGLANKLGQSRHSSDRLRQDGAHPVANSDPAKCHGCLEMHLGNGKSVR